MSASGSFDYLVTASDIITGAMENLGVLAAGDTPTSSETTMALRTLNLLAKQMMGNGDSDLGMKMWCRKRVYVFLQDGEETYSLGPSGDSATESYVTTTLSAAATAGASTISVTSASGMATTYVIGIQLDSGALQWTTINGAPSGTTITLTATLTGAAASGNRVFCYQTALAFRPLEILTAVIRDADNQDTPINPMSLQQYETIGRKTDEADPTRFYYESQLTNGVLYLDNRPSDVSKVLRLVVLSPVDDFDSSSNDVVFPQQCFASLEWGLTKRLAPKFGRPWDAAMESNYKEAMLLGQNVDPDTSELYFMPGIE